MDAPMNIDQRLDRLTERHEALAQSMELTHHDLQQNGEQIRALARVVETDAENIRALARIAEIHERRLTHLEGQ
jgi:hypothetical protein